MTISERDNVNHTLMITKIDAAEQQLNTAIRLFFENRDSLSAYVLAVASREVTNDLVESRYSELYQRELARVGDPQKVRLSIRDEWKIRIKSECQRDFFRLDHKVQNFLKHADQDPNAEIKQITGRQLAFAIISAIWNYVLLARCRTAEMAIFFAWFEVAEPQVIRDSPEHEDINKASLEMRNFIGRDPYGRETLLNIYKAMQEKI